MRFKSESYDVGDQSWLGSAHGIANSRTSTLKASDFTKATHYPNGYLPSGTPVDCTNEQALKPWTGTGTLGFVLFDQPLNDTDKGVAVPVFRHGTVRVHRIPGDFTKPTNQSQFVFIEGSDA